VTRERREEIVALALAISLVLHIGVMFYAKSKVMTHIARGFARVTHRQPMRMDTKSPPPPAAITGEATELAPAKDAPAAVGPEDPALTGTVEPMESKSRPLPPVLADAAVPEIAPASFDFDPPKFDGAKVSAKIPVAEILPPVPVCVAGAAQPMPSAPVAFSPPKMPAVGVDPDSMFAPSRLADQPVAEFKRIRSEAAKPKFVPSDEVYEKVDEQVVKSERQAVKDLLDADGAEELERFADAQIVCAGEDGWTYFKVMVNARASLPVVPKDVVVLIDASGSIGRERMASIRHAAKRLVRSLTNTGDRFNLVAFRDRYSYAFKRWQDCSRTAFERADEWIDDLAAHGRTDVFATIRSVLTLPRSPERALIALVVTDADANYGLSETSKIISRFTALNDGLVSLYMYGVKSEANRELIEALTRGNRGESFVYSGRKARSGSGIEGLSERFRDPVLSDIRVIFTAQSRAEAYPRRLRNLYRGGVLELYGRVPAGVKKVAFSLRGLNGKKPYTGFYSFDLSAAPVDSTAVAGWKDEKRIDLKLK
jgi:hypothetical protein